MISLRAGAAAASAALALSLLAAPGATIPTAAAAGRERPKPVTPPPRLTMGDATVHLIVHGGRRFRVRNLVARQPCYRFIRAANRTTVCLRGSGSARVTQTGRAAFTVPVKVTRPARRTLMITARRADLMLPTGNVVAKAWCRARECGRIVRRARIPVLRMQTCTARGPWLVRGTPKRVGKAVALTFDDGPGVQTESTLRMLKREGVPGTFFQVGVNVRSRNLERRIRKGGHVLANHTHSHVTNPGYEQLARASRRIRKASGFRPCLFRAPGGVNPPSVVGTARSLGMVTVNWNVDPYDWRGTSRAGIVRISMAQTRPGSILLYHDGGRNRAMVPAVRQVIRTLKAKGYRFLTVPELLRLSVTYR